MEKLGIFVYVARCKVKYCSYKGVIIAANRREACELFNEQYGELWMETYQDAEGDVLPGLQYIHPLEEVDLFFLGFAEQEEPHSEIIAHHSSPC